MRALLSAVLCTGVMARVAVGQAPPPPAAEPGATQLALANLPPKDKAAIVVTTPAFKRGEDIPFENTQYKGNVFPGLDWTAGPKGTKSYVVIMQDGDALRNGAPILHWTMANIPASVTHLAVAMADPPAGASYGPNIRGAKQPYMGPHTPAGPKHRYHIQVFALDRTIPVAALGTYDGLMSSMKGHVLSSGEIIGLGQAMP